MKPTFYLLGGVLSQNFHQLKNGFKALFLLVGILIGRCDNLSAQYTQDQFRKYTFADGLSNSFVKSITQDDKGFMWIATEYGLNRFDGNHFDHFFFTSEGGENKGANVIKSMTNLGNDELGIATVFGAFVFNTQLLTYQELKFSTDERIRYWSHSVHQVQKDKGGNYLISTGTGLYIFDKSKKLRKRKDGYKFEDSASGFLTYGDKLTKLTNGSVLQQMDFGWNIYDYERDSIIQIEIEDQKNIKEKDFKSDVLYGKYLIQHAFKDQWVSLVDENLKILCTTQKTNNLKWYTKVISLDDSTMIYNANLGLHRLKFDSKCKTIEATNLEELPNIPFFTIFKDNTNRLWLGGKSGLYKELTTQNTAQSIEMVYNDKIIDVNPLNLLSTNQKLIITNKDYSIYIFDKSKNKVEKIIPFDKKEFNSNPNNSSFLLDSNNVVISLNSQAIKLNLKTYAMTPFHLPGLETIFEKYQITQIHTDKFGHIWIATNGNIVIKWEKGKEAIIIKNSFDKIRRNTITEDKNGNICVLSENCYFIEKGSDHITKQLEKPFFLPDYVRVYGFSDDREGNTWYRARGEPWTIKKRYGKIKVLDAEDLYPDMYDFIFSVDGYLFYLNNVRNLIQLNVSNFEYIKYNVASDFSLNNPVSRISLDEKRKILYFATDKGISYFNYESKNTPRARTIKLLEIVIDDKQKINYPSNITELKYSQNSFAMKFVSLDFEDDDNLQYSYRHKGAPDSNWIKLNEPIINFSNLYEGTYHIELKVASDNHTWSPIKREMIIKIRPPFFRTWWFIIGIVGLLFSIFWKIFRIQIEKVRLEKKALNYEIKALYTQMNPHFIFNALNSMKQMILFDDGKNASKYLSKFAELIRLNLEHSKKENISIDENIVYLTKYLEMEKLRFPNLCYEISSNDIDINIKMPSMLLQPLVENALVHGFNAKTEEPFIKIDFYQNSNAINIDVIDNGSGLQNNEKGFSTHKSVAISNIKARMEILNSINDKNFNLNIINRKNISVHSGVISRISFNI